MKLKINCMQCFQIEGKPSEEFIPIEMTDNRLLRATCSNGHTTLTALQQQKFEILFHFGAMALLDGYSREAIASFAASLERFYEFYIRVICAKRNISAYSFNKTWKNVSNQSERQYGAFLFLYMYEKYIPHIPISKKWPTFRNKVIHQGYIPTYQETIKYGEILFEFISKNLSDLKKEYSEHIQTVIVKDLQRANNCANGKTIATLSIPTIINISRERSKGGTFLDALDAVKKYKGIIRFEK